MAVWYGRRINDLRPTVTIKLQANSMAKDAQVQLLATGGRHPSPNLGYVNPPRIFENSFTVEPRLVPDGGGSVLAAKTSAGFPAS